MNKREQGQDYRNRVLSLLAVTGYATTRQVAKGIWKRCDISARKMAGRTLRRLLDERLIVSKRGGHGIIKLNNELIFALNAAGATEARRNGDPIVGDKEHGRDLIKNAHDHRTACNSVYLAWPSSVNIWSELQVRGGESPVCSFRFPIEHDAYEEKYATKVPDLIAEAGNGRYEWIEVENSWRSGKDLEKLVLCMQEMFKQGEGKGEIDCMHFVIAVPGARTIAKRLKERLMLVVNSGEYRHIREISARIITKHIRVSELDPLTLRLIPILDD